MRAWSWSYLFAAVVVLSIGGCSKTHHAGDARGSHLPEAGAGDVDTRAPDARAVPMRAPDAGNAPMQPADAGMGFVRIPFEAGNQCAPTRLSMAIGAPPNVFITTGCGFYSVDTESYEVVLLQPQGDTIDEDGNTIAVIAGKLGLSLDRGATFTWTDWALGRCQGTPDVTAGDGLAVVSCVANAGRWRGEGNAFETLTLGSAGGILPSAAARDSHVIINQTDGWYESTDRGDSFTPLRVDGLPDGARPDGVEIVASKLFALVQVGAGTDASHMELFAAPLGSGSFARLTAFPPTRSQVWLSSNEEILIAIAGSELYFSTDAGESFTTQKLDGIPISWGTVAKYGSGHLYILTPEALYVGTLASHP